MTQISKSTTLNAPANEVWGTVGDFNGIPKFVPVFSARAVDGAGVGARRTLTLRDGGTVLESLESLDDEARTLTYAIIESPLPLAGYVSTMAVRDLGDGRCEFNWSCSFDAQGAPEADVVAIVEGVYAAGLDGLRQLHGG